MRIFTAFLAALALPALAQHAPAAVAPSGVTVLLDTTLGRITCRLYDKQAPLASARFVKLAQQKFYDGTILTGISDGFLGGAYRGTEKLTGGEALPAEKSILTYDRPGRLVITSPPPGADPAKAPDTPNMFSILEHADMEYRKRGGTIFGQCTDDSLPVITAISHALLTVDNRPSTALTLDHVTVLEPGAAPPPAPPAPPESAYLLAPAPASAAAIPSPEPTGPTAVIETTKGTLTCRLFKDETPVATANFIGLATGTKDWHSPATKALMHGRRFYEGLSFRRVIPDFMVQQADMPGDPGGDGDLGFHFASEIVPGLTFDRPGRLAYANAGPNTNQSEFFITEHPVHRLDGNYTIFGQCDEASVYLAEAMARVPRDEHNRPLTPLLIKRITFR